MNNLIVKIIITAVSFLLGIATLQAQELTVSTTNIQVASASGSTTTFAISSDSYWGIYSIPDWIKLDTVWGNGNRTITLKAQENPFAIARRADIVVYWLNANWQYYSDVHLSVIQSASAVGLTDSVFTIGADEGSTTSLSIPFSSYWEVIDLPSWLSVNKSFGSSSATVTLTAQKNPLLIVRPGQFRVRKLASDASYTYATVVVNQTASKTGISINELTFDAAAGSQKDIMIFLGSAWSITGLPSWLSASTLSMPGNAVVYFTASENTSVYYRVDNFYITTNTGISIKIVAKQKPAKAFLSISPSAFNFSENENSIQVQINSNTNWGLIDFPDWIDSENIFGYTDSTLSLSYNDFEAGRRDTVIAYWFDENEIYKQKAVIVGQGLALNSDEHLRPFLNINPNPVNNILHIDFPSNKEISRVDVFSDSGSLLISFDYSVSEIDFSALPNAVYYIIIYVGDEVFTGKIIKK